MPCRAPGSSLRAVMSPSVLCKLGDGTGLTCFGSLDVTSASGLLSATEEEDMVDGKQVALLAVHLSKLQPMVAIRCTIALSASHVSDAENLLG